MSNMFKDAKDLETVLGELAGYASLCWNQEVHTNLMVFDSGKAAMAVEDARVRIKELQRKVDHRFGNIDIDNNKIYVFFTAEDAVPVAMYVGGNGEYDAYYDFTFNYCGSPLADVCGRTTYDEFMENVAEGLIEHGWEFENVVMDSSYQVHPELGISIEEIFDEAYKYLVEVNYDQMPETAVLYALRVADKWA
jgi:hypothetical protein